MGMCCGIGVVFVVLGPLIGYYFTLLEICSQSGFVPKLYVLVKIVGGRRLAKRKKSRLFKSEVSFEVFGKQYF